MARAAVLSPLAAAWEAWRACSWAAHSAWVGLAEPASVVEGKLVGLRSVVVAVASHGSTPDTAVGRHPNRVPANNVFPFAGQICGGVLGQLVQCSATRSAAWVSHWA